MLALHICKRDDFLGFLAVFLIVANLGSVLMVEMASFIWLLIFFVCVVQIIKKRIIIAPKLISTLFVIWICVTISAFLTDTEMKYYKDIFIGSLLAFLVIVANNYDKTRLKDYIYKSCRIICMLGFVNFLLYTFFPFLYSELTTNSGYYTRSIMYIFNYETGELINRNRGLYWEPGVFQIILNIYLFLVIFEKKEHLKKALFPILVIITTFSTTGILIMFLLISYHIMKNKLRKLNLKKIFISLLIAGPLLMLLFINVENKLKSEVNPSAALRTYDQLMGLQIISENPIIGIGLDPTKYVKSLKTIDIGPYDISELDIDRGSSNGILIIGVSFGLPILFLFLYSLYQQSLFFNKRIFFLLIFLELLSEPLIGFPLIFLFNMACVNINDSLIRIKEYDRT